MERLAVLAYETAHVKLHFRRKQRGQTLLVDDPKQAVSRDVKELEAELTAFLLLELSGIDCSQGSAAYLNSWKASASKIRGHAERCFVVACSVLRGCEKKRYRRLVEEGSSKMELSLSRTRREQRCSSRCFLNGVRSSPKEFTYRAGTRPVPQQLQYGRDEIAKAQDAFVHGPASSVQERLRSSAWCQ